MAGLKGSKGEVEFASYGGQHGHCHPRLTITTTTTTTTIITTTTTTSTSSSSSASAPSSSLSSSPLSSLASVLSPSSSSSPLSSPTLSDLSSLSSLSSLSNLSDISTGLTYPPTFLPHAIHTLKNQARPRPSSNEDSAVSVSPAHDGKRTHTTALNGNAHSVQPRKRARLSVRQERSQTNGKTGKRSLTRRTKKRGTVSGKKKIVIKDGVAYHADWVVTCDVCGDKIASDGEGYYCVLCEDKRGEWEYESFDVCGKCYTSADETAHGHAHGKKSLRPRAEKCEGAGDNKAVRGVEAMESDGPAASSLKRSQRKDAQRNGKDLAQVKGKARKKVPRQALTNSGNGPRTDDTASETRAQGNETHDRPKKTKPRTPKASRDAAETPADKGTTEMDKKEKNDSEQNETEQNTKATKQGGKPVKRKDLVVKDGQEFTTHWQVSCDHCDIPIIETRYYCRTCERRKDEWDHESFDLCQGCFRKLDQTGHVHPASEFRQESLLKVGPFLKADEMAKANSKGGVRCVLCQGRINMNEGLSVGRDMAHVDCLLASPEVVRENGKWFQASDAVKRGKALDCAHCGLRGATIGCFRLDCEKSYHFPCTFHPVSFFKEGGIFFCPAHIGNTCKTCETPLDGGEFWKCKRCGDVYFCDACFHVSKDQAPGNGPNHPHLDHAKYMQFVSERDEDIYQEKLLSERVLSRRSLLESERQQRKRRQGTNDPKGELAKLRKKPLAKVEPDWESIDSGMSCELCTGKIWKYRIFCKSCEPLGGYNLCISCFTLRFGRTFHEHPQQSFAVAWVYEKMGIVPPWFGACSIEVKDVPPDGEVNVGKKKACVLCKRRLPDIAWLVDGVYWCHEECVRFSPEILVGSDERMYNALDAIKRGRLLKCTGCRYRGATIGCFHPHCNRSYHFSCTHKPADFFRRGAIFFCPSHEPHREFEDVYDCDGCREWLKDTSWWTCKLCKNWFDTFDLCNTCFEADVVLGRHQHDKSAFYLTSKALAEEEDRFLASMQHRPEGTEGEIIYNPKVIWKRLKEVTCGYCWRTTTKERWFKVYESLVLCLDCYQKGGPDLDTVVSLEVESPKLDETWRRLRVLPTYEPMASQRWTMDIHSSYFDIPGRIQRWASHSNLDYSGTWIPQIPRWSILRYTQPQDVVFSTFVGRGTDLIEAFLLGRNSIGVDINPIAIRLAQTTISFSQPLERRDQLNPALRPRLVHADARDGRFQPDASVDHVLTHPPYKTCIQYCNHIPGDLSGLASTVEYLEAFRRVARETARILKPNAYVTLMIGDNREYNYFLPLGFRTLAVYLRTRCYELVELIVRRQRLCRGMSLGTFISRKMDFLMFAHEFIVVLRKRLDSSEGSYGESLKAALAQGADVQVESDRLPLPEVADGMAGHAMEAQYVFMDTFTVTHSTYPNKPNARNGAGDSNRDFDSVAMGSVWTFHPSHINPEPYFTRNDPPPPLQWIKDEFPTATAVKVAERFGIGKGCWERIEIKDIADSLEHPLAKFTSDSEGGFKATGPVLLPKSAAEELSEYDKERQDKIRKKNELLGSLGFAASDPTEIQAQSLPAPVHLDAGDELDMVIVPHVEMMPRNLTVYRRFLIAVAARYNVRKLVIGVKDVRSGEDGTLTPMGLLVLEDIERAKKWKMKELVISVPSGFEVRPHQALKHQEGLLPTVHAYYLIFEEAPDPNRRLNPKAHTNRRNGLAKKIYAWQMEH